MTLRRILHSFERGILAPLAPALWTPLTSSFCDKCASHYPRSTCFYEQEAGHRAAGPRCEVCDHAVRREEIVEEDKTTVKVLVQCHGQDELHIHDLGSVTWSENATDPDDRYELLRQVRLQARYFVPTEQGEKTVVGGAGT